MTSWLDNVATRGLLGVANSLSYRITEIERHFHHWERWFGLATAPDAEVHRGDRLGASVAPFRIDAGNNTWGAWVQILGSSDTPAIVGSVKFDPHRIEVVEAERAKPYFIQIAAGASGADALTAGTYTEYVYSPLSGVNDSGPVDFGFRRQPVGTKVWARCLSPLNDTAWIDFSFGLHEYEG